VQRQPVQEQVPSQKTKKLRIAKLINLNVEPSDLQLSLRRFSQSQRSQKVLQVSDKHKAFSRHIKTQASHTFEKKVKENSDEGLQTNGH
jgi:translation initiation factor 2 alpha subunit (eIF-2alpha)